jgi:hypothetical protein
MYTYLKELSPEVPVLKHHAVKMNAGIEVKLRTFLKSPLYGCELTASFFSLFIPEERTTVPTEYEAAWVPEPVLKQCHKKKYLLLPGIEHGASIPLYVQLLKFSVLD